MPGGSPSSYEDLAAENAALHEMVAELRAVVGGLQAEVAELRRQLGQNSRNSSKPPSSDSPFGKPALRSLRRKSGRKPGGQPGHPGSTLALVSDPVGLENSMQGPDLRSSRAARAWIIIG